MKLSCAEFLLFSGLFLIANGCAMTIPMSEFGTPETLGAGGVRVQPLGVGTAPLVRQEPSETQSWFGARTQAVASAGLAVGVHDQVDLEFSLFAGLGSAARFGLKWQLLGSDHYFDAHSGTWIASVAARYTIAENGDPNDPYPDPSADFAAAAHYLQLSFPVGYRLTPAASWYAAPKLITGDVNLATRNGDDNGWTRLRENYWGYGCSTGVGLHPHSRHLGIELLSEVSFMNLPAPDLTGRTTYICVNLSLALPFHF